MKKLLIILVFVSIFAQETTHAVKPGDTLWDIAGMYYQNPFLWPYIWRANLTKVEDPHWIYPDQVFVIPPAPEEMVGAVPETPEVTEPAEMPEEPEYVPEVVMTIPPKEKAAAVITVVSPEMRVFSEDMINRAGYILEEDIPYWSKIIQTEPEGEKQITTFKKIYIDRATDIEAGDILTIYRSGKIITDPEDGEYLGKEITVLGRAEVEAVAEGGSRCKVITSYDIMKTGDLVTPYSKIMAPVDVELVPSETKLEAYIVEMKTFGLLTSPYSYAYINRGEDDNVAVGDIFEIYQKRSTASGPLPDFKIGAVQIVSVFRRVSIALLLSYRETPIIKRGEHCRLAMEAR